MGLPDLHVFVINLDNLRYTKDCIADLMKQEDMDYDLTVVDNASTEFDTKEYLTVLRNNGIRVIEHANRVPLNHLWNGFYHDNQNKYLCMLNNDVRVAYNFTKTIRQVFEKEENVKIVCHATNNREYCTAHDSLSYKTLNRACRQGWDYTIRRDAYVLIPDEMKIYFGDDWLYANVYDSGGDAAIILNSPIIHYLGMSIKSLHGNPYHEDEQVWLKHGHTDKYSAWSGFSKGKPDFPTEGFFKYEPKITVGLVTYERHKQLEDMLGMFKSQTDPRFILDIWQDGPDDVKRKLVTKMADPRLVYNENPVRQKLYGHDMRHKSCMACKTDYWCTVNDDNLVSPFFVEEILKNVIGHDMMIYSVAMENIPKGSLSAAYETIGHIHNGNTDFDFYNTTMKTLDPNYTICGDIDACSCIVKADIMRKYGGWWSMEFMGDYFVFDKLLQEGIKPVRLKKVLQCHR